VTAKITKTKVMLTQKEPATKPLPRQHLRDQIAQQIKALIAAEQLVPGDRLPTESELAQRFGVSRPSLREATKSLEFLGILQSKTGVGLTVGHFDIGRMTDHLGFHPALQAADAQQLIDSRVVVETGVLPFVSQRIQQNPEIAEALQKVVHQLRDAKTLEAKIDLDIEFHRKLLEASGLSPLIAFGDLLQIFFLRFRESVRAVEWTKAVAGHQHLLDLLKAGRVAKATEELKAHIESHRERMQKPKAKSRQR